MKTEIACLDHGFVALVDTMGSDRTPAQTARTSFRNRKERTVDRPIKSRRGEDFATWRDEIISYGYSFESRVLRACDFGSPTSRPRLYIAMRADGQSFAWPEPTHGPSRAQPHRTAAEIIDWSIPCPSIFDRVKPHVPAPRRRLAKGMRKFVLEAAQPFVLPVKTWGGGGNEPRALDEPMRTVTASKRGEFAVARPFLLHLTHGDRHAPHSVDEPVPTVTAANRGEQAIAVPFMIHRSNGERAGQEPRTYDVRKPHPAIVAGGLKTSPVLAFLAKAYSERRTTEVQASDMRVPLGVVTAQDHHHLVAVSTTKFYGTSTGVLAASLLRYNSENSSGSVRGQQLDLPIHTLDASNRYAIAEYPLAAAEEWSDVIAAKARRVYRFLVEEGVVGPWLDHEHQLVRLPACPDLVVYDIGMRMLVPRELFRANGFADSYVIDLIGPRGKPLTKTEQVRLVGNSVCPDVAEALVRAAIGPSEIEQLREAA